MPSARYTPISTSNSHADTERELNEAFESDNDDDDDERGTLIQHHHSTIEPSTPDEPTSSIPGAYDFERERTYDYPPPGSPPPLTSRALPNDYGNSNGLLPSSSSTPNPPPQPRPSFFRRAVGAILPSHYVRVPTELRNIRVGGGIENDGVFANVTAKPGPQRNLQIETADGSVYMVPEENQKEVPPSYADAQADAVPPYWETTVHAPNPNDPNADMLVDDLPTGSIWLFAINLFISWFFQFIGFLFTYLLHTSHAAKFGSRAGLGLTLIQFGFYSKGMGTGDDESTQELDNHSPILLNSTWTRAGTPTQSVSAPIADDTLFASVSSRDWLAFLFMTLGWFIFLSSVIGFFRVKRWESSIRRAAEPPTPITPDAIERDIAIRRNIANVFGVSFDEDEERRAHDVQSRSIRAAEDARLTRDLRAAGLI